MLPLHMILGMSRCNQIKTKHVIQTGDFGEPCAEYTVIDWTVVSGGK